MKKSIVLSALVSLLSVGTLLAATPVENVGAGAANVISINSLKSNIGVAVSVNGQISGKAIVEIADNDGNKLYKTALKSQAKGFNLSELEDGDYTITVSAGNQAVKKQVHIYNEGAKKAFFIVQ